MHYLKNPQALLSSARIFLSANRLAPHLTDFEKHFLGNFFPYWNNMQYLSTSGKMMFYYKCANLISDYLFRMDFNAARGCYLPEKIELLLPVIEYFGCEAKINDAVSWLEFIFEIKMQSYKALKKIFHGLGVVGKEDVRCPDQSNLNNGIRRYPAHLMGAINQIDFHFGGNVPKILYGSSVTGSWNSKVSDIDINFLCTWRSRNDYVKDIQFLIQYNAQKGIRYPLGFILIPIDCFPVFTIADCGADYLDANRSILVADKPISVTTSDDHVRACLCLARVAHKCLLLKKILVEKSWRSLSDEKILSALNYARDSCKVLSSVFGEKFQLSGMVLAKWTKAMLNKEDIHLAFEMENAKMRKILLAFMANIGEAISNI